MKRFLTVVGILCLILCFSIFLMTGCAKKALVNEAAATKEQAAADKEKKEGTIKSGEAAEKEKSTAEMASKEQAASGAEGATKDDKTLANIYFEFDNYNLKPDAREILKGHAAWLAKNVDYLLVVEGHCDERGTTEYNLALGERRASEAKKYLVELGINVNRMKTISYGKEMPLDPGHSEEAWAKNRRDNFVIKIKK